MGTTNVQVLGLSELNKMLQQMPAKIEKNILTGGLRAGVKVFQVAARQNLPANLLDLQRSLKIRTSSKYGRLTATLVAGSSQAYYAHWVEYGTASYYTGKGKSVGKPYPIKPLKKGGQLKIGNTYTSLVMHPGVKPRPYMRPALDQNADQSIRAVADYVRSRIEVELKK